MERKTIKSGDFVISMKDGKEKKVRYIRDLDRQLTLVCYADQANSVYVENNGMIEELKIAEIKIGE